MDTISDALENAPRKQREITVFDFVLPPRLPRTCQHKHLRESGGSGNGNIASWTTLRRLPQFAPAYVESVRRIASRKACEPRGEAVIMGAFGRDVGQTAARMGVQQNQRVTKPCEWQFLTPAVWCDG